MDHIKMDFKDVKCGAVECSGLAEDRDRWRALVNAVMEPSGPMQCGKVLD